MRVLLDHNLPHKLRTSLGKLCEHEIVTASFMRWGHLKNGELLRAAEEAGVAVFVSGDRTLVHEQNLSGRRLALIALSANNWPIIRDYLPAILVAIESAQPSSFHEVDCGTFSRKKPTAE